MPLNYICSIDFIVVFRQGIVYARLKEKLEVLTRLNIADTFASDMPEHRNLLVNTLFIQPPHPHPHPLSNVCLDSSSLVDLQGKSVTGLGLAGPVCAKNSQVKQVLQVVRVVQPAGSEGSAVCR